MKTPSTNFSPAPAQVKVEVDALENLVVAAAVNKRLLMRILAHLERRELADLHDEVAALDHEFRHTVHAGMAAEAEPLAEERVPRGDLPVGREEERRGHALANADTKTSSADSPVIGKDLPTRKGS
jgi:hypothetical protein